MSFNLDLQTGKGDEAGATTAPGTIGGKAPRGKWCGRAVPSSGGKNGMTSDWILGVLEEIRSETGKRGRRRLLH